MNKLTSFAKELKGFDKYNELRGVRKVPLENREALINLVSESFERICAEDDSDVDYDPLPFRVFTTKEDDTMGAVYQMADNERHLERTDIHLRERRMLRVHQTLGELAVFRSFAHPDSLQVLECFRLDYQQPNQSFYQMLNLAPDPWLYAPAGGK
mgnify:CR=1 FL=1